MTTWSELHKAALATIEDAEQKLTELKTELTTNEDVKSALLEVGEKDVSEDDEDDEDVKQAIENITDVFDEAQGKLSTLAKDLVSSANALHAVL